MRLAIHVALLVGLVGGFAAVARADDRAADLVAAGDVGASVAIEPEVVVVGQRAVLSVTLRTTTWFAAAATLPDPEVPGLFIRRYATMGVNGTDRRDGRTFTTQRWEWYLFAPRPGRFEIPPLDVVVRPAGEDRKAVEVPIRTEGLAFEAAWPEEAGGEPYLVATPALTLEETLDRDLDGLRVGDAVVRTLRVEMDGVPAMFLPPLDPEATPGMAAYVATPRVEDAFSRGVLRGSRVEEVTYVFERPGSYRLPAYRLPWWNTEAGRIDTAVVEGHELEVAPHPELAAGGAAVDPDAGGRRSPLEGLLDVLPWIAGLLALAVLVGRGVRRYGTPLVAAWRAWRAARRDAEPVHFARVQDAAGRGDAAATRDALRRWLDRIRGPGATFQDLSDAAGDVALTRELARLGERLYGRSGEAWSGTELLEALERARQEALRPEDPETHGLRLNPGPGGSSRP